MHNGVLTLIRSLTTRIPLPAAQCLLHKLKITTRLLLSRRTVVNYLELATPLPDGTLQQMEVAPHTLPVQEPSL